jgi:NADH-quinone oxidoreductase subunit N
MVLTAGLWEAFQRDLARLLGYGVIVETGYSLLAISLASRIGDQLFASMFLPRVIGLALWALSLSVLLREARSTRFEDVEGLAQRMPFASAGLAVASLTLGGLPLLAVFPIHQVLLEQLSQRSLITALGALVGSVGMLFSTFRALTVLARGNLQDILATSVQRPAQPEPNPEAPAPRALPLPRSYCESPAQVILIVSGIVSLLLIGIFPQFFLPLLNGLLASYPQLP